MPGVKSEKCLKRDTFGEIWAVDSPAGCYIERRVSKARPWARWLAHWLARREATALAQADGIPGVPELLSSSSMRIRREWIRGSPMQEARPVDSGYFREALTLLRRLHRSGVAHNDLAKEPNWLVTDDGHVAVIDFQLATVSRNRGFIFRILAREDLRHLLKHKRTYCPESLTARQRSILDNPAMVSRVWMASGKKIYLFVTRRLLGWADREGAGDRQGL